MQIVAAWRPLAGDIAIGDFALFVPIPEDGVWTPVKCEGFTDGASTVTFNIEERADPLVAGTDILTSDLTADNGGEATTDFDVTPLTPGRYLVLTISAFADAPTVLQVFLTLTASGG